MVELSVTQRVCLFVCLFIGVEGQSPSQNGTQRMHELCQKQYTIHMQEIQNCTRYDISKLNPQSHGVKTLISLTGTDKGLVVQPLLYKRSDISPPV